MSANRSIQKISLLGGIRGEVVFSCLVPLFQNSHSFDTLDVRQGRVGAECLRSLTSALREFTSLKVFNVENLQEGDPLLEALAGHIGLETIGLCYVRVGQRGFSALSTLFQNPRSELTKLVLTRCIDDEGAELLAIVLLSSRLKELSLENSLSERGWMVLFTALGKPGCCLEKLTLGCGGGIDLATAQFFSQSLSKNSTLKALEVGRYEDISLDLCWTIWRAMFRFLRSPHTVLEVLDLTCDFLNDLSIVALASDLAENKCLKELYLGLNDDVSPEAWKNLSAVLRYPDSALVILDLSQNSGIKDDVAASFADALVNNTTLCRLNLGDNDYITYAGWKTFLPLLCDDSSIMTTYCSI